MSSSRRILFPAILAAFALIGAGCEWTQSVSSMPIASPITAEGTQSLIKQANGFGRLPRVPAPVLHPGTSGSILIKADIPMVPPQVSVLRIPSGRPNPTELQNIAAALGIRGGSIDQTSEANALNLEWRNADGSWWTYVSSERRLEFVDASYVVPMLTVSEWPARKNVMESVLRFMKDHGVNARTYAEPYVAPDWASWWKDAAAKGRCMSVRTLETVRDLSVSLTSLQQGPPSLPAARDVSCVHPEFPSRIIIQFDALQDGQALRNGDGTSKHGATVVIDANNLHVISARFFLKVDPERSDYPGISNDDVKRRLSAGGLGGTPPGDLTIKRFNFEWLYRVDPRASDVTFLYPALVGEGSITYPDKSTGPYWVVVPLVKE